MMLGMTARSTLGRMLPEWPAVLSCVRFRLRQACPLAVGDSRRVCLLPLRCWHKANLSRRPLSQSATTVEVPSLKCFGRCLEPHHKDTFEAGVRSHSVEPWAQRRAFLDAVAIPPGTKQRLLHRVLGVRQGAEHAVTVDKQFAAMTLDIATELV